MDSFPALFKYFTPSAQAFFSGNLRNLVDFNNDDDEMGHLHIFQGGQLTVTCNDREPLQLTQPAMLVMPRNLSHRFIPDPIKGADMICAKIKLGSGDNNPFMLGLPDILIIPFDQAGAVAPTLDLMVAEAFAAHYGRQIALDRLFEYLILQIIRHVIDKGLVSSGLLNALAEPRLARVINVIYEKPEQLWTLDDLAALAGMSRNAFARHFRAILGTTPMAYLTRWRMAIVQNILRKGGTIKSATSAVGYDSAAALSRSFTKIIGASPRQWLAQQDID